MGRTKYANEEERKAARREYMKEYGRKYREEHRATKCEYDRKYREEHREAHCEYMRKYNRKSGQAKSAVGYEVLTIEDMEQLSKAPTDMSVRVIKDMDIDFTIEYQNQFKQLLNRHIVPTEEDIDEAWKLARSSVSGAGPKRGYLFESVMRKNILYELRMKQQKYYTQINIDGGATRIDSVISNEVLEDKTKLNLSQAVIVSTKTSLATKWKEDMHLYSRCKAYVMVTLDDKFPSAALPDNVYFCSPHVTERSAHIINLNDLLPTVMQYLEPEEQDAETNEETNAETTEDTTEDTTSDASEQ